MTGFLDEENGLVYVGDSFFGEKLLSAVGMPYLIDWSLFKESLEALLGLAERGYTLIPSHGRPVQDKEAVELIEFNLGRIDEIENMSLELLKRPRSVDELVFRVMKHYGVEVTLQRLALNLVPIRALIAGLNNKSVIEAVVEEGLKWRTVKG